MVQTVSGKLYTGIAKSAEKRFLEHQNDTKKGAKFFRSDPPKAIVYIEKAKDRSEASKREYKIKQMTRKQKLKLVESHIKEC